MKETDLDAMARAISTGISGETIEEVWSRRCEDFPKTTIFVYEFAVHELRKFMDGEVKISHRQKAQFIRSLTRSIAMMTPEVRLARQELAERVSEKTKTTDPELS